MSCIGAFMQKYKLSCASAEFEDVGQLQLVISSRWYLNPVDKCPIGRFEVNNKGSMDICKREELVTRSPPIVKIHATRLALHFSGSHVLCCPLCLTQCICFYNLAELEHRMLFGAGRVVDRNIHDLEKRVKRQRSY